MDTNTETARKQMEAQVLDRAMKDATFRQELLHDPKGVLARELQRPIPAHLTVQVLEESPPTIYLVLPRGPVSAGAELADADLEEVAGRSTVDRREPACFNQGTEWSEEQGATGC